MTRTLRFAILFFGSAFAAVAAGDKPEGNATVIDAARKQALVKRAKADCESITTALQMYKINNGAFPTEKQGLKALVEKPAEAPLPRRWVKMMDKVPLDPWDREYRLVVRKKEGKETFFVASGGPDPDDPADDIEHPLEKPATKE